VFPQTRPFCRVSYIGFTLVRASIALHETWSTLKRFRYFIKRLLNRAGERTKLFCVCVIPNRPSKLACDILQRVNLGVLVRRLRRDVILPHAFLATIGEGPRMHFPSGDSHGRQTSSLP
jgi:hypothetical protein